MDSSSSVIADDEPRLRPSAPRTYWLRRALEDQCDTAVEGDRSGAVHRPPFSGAGAAAAGTRAAEVVAGARAVGGGALTVAAAAAARAAGHCPGCRAPLLATQAQVPLVQLPEQHSPSPPQITPAVEQAHMPVPESHTPEQHSALELQTSPVVAHAQVLPTQLPEQHLRRRPGTRRSRLAQAQTSAPAAAPEQQPPAPLDQRRSGRNATLAAATAGPDPGRTARSSCRPC